jgi:hypothetical protein
MGDEVAALPAVARNDKGAGFAFIGDHTTSKS